MEYCIKKIMQRFGCKHKVKITQCENNKKNLKELLDKLYDEYHENEYKKWCEVHDDLLMKVKFELVNIASQGLCYYEIVLSFKKSTRDKWHF